MSQPVKRNTGLAADWHSSTPRCFEHLAQPRITNAFSDHDAIDATRSRTQGFKHRQHSVDVRHKLTF
jgi:hypothetical protein